METLQQLTADDFCYLTTTGRVTGRPHTIEIWFAVDGNTLFMLAGGGERPDWVKNATQTPEVDVRIRDIHFSGQARRVTEPDEDALARRIVVAKYQPRSGDELNSWGRTSLPIAVDISGTKELCAGDVLRHRHRS